MSAFRYIERNTLRCYLHKAFYGCNNFLAFDRKKMTFRWGVSFRQHSSTACRSLFTVPYIHKLLVRK